MSVLIKGMKMPNKCEECPLSFRQQDSDQGGCVVTNYYIYRKWGERKPYWCPLVEVVMPNIVHWLNDIEIVRCHDCKHKDGHYCHNKDGFAEGNFVRDDDYCSRGELELEEVEE
jgi:hypothetical protein